MEYVFCSENMPLYSLNFIVISCSWFFPSSRQDEGPQL
uniref:Uncharacterized protein n=1 Tax=Nelumbo nucifera TaxID=4432 RepID=A0A822YG08_NELNU|nr:TPA_asm: hypothetical protein HUJ06_010203 [Nelumbo nucifera]